MRLSNGLIKLKLRNSFPALFHMNFRYFWFGQCVSLIGTWMQNIAQSWLVYSLTKSPLLLGLVGFCQFMPVLVLSLFVGVYVDKLPKRKILIYTQGLSALLAFILAFLVWSQYIRYWHVLILAALLGIINTFDMPTRQSFVVDLVGKKDLMNAIALNSSVFNAARIVGPAVAGVIMAKFGVSFCFFINAVSYIPVIFGISKINVTGLKSNKAVGQDLLKDMKDGLSYIRKNEILVRTIMAVTVMGIFAMNFSVLVPVLATEVLGQEETGFGFLMSAMGIGSLLGAMILATKSKTVKMNFILTFNAFAVAILLILIGLTEVYGFIMFLLAITGMLNTMFFTSANSTLQINAKDEYRGRVMSVYSLVFGGATPIGNLFAGGTTNRFGVQMGFVLSGAVVLFCMIVLSVTQGRDRKPV